MTAIEPADPTERLRDLGHASVTAKAAAAAYAATHGHIPGTGDPQHEAGRARWALHPRTAIIATSVLLFVSCFGTYLISRPDGEAPVVELVSVRPDDANSDNIQMDASSAATASATSSSEPFTIHDGIESQPLGVTAGGLESPNATGQQTEFAAEQVVVVDVVGQVNSPGLVRLAVGARVGDAVEAAGGPTATADVSAINMARIVTDGEQIRVPAPGEEVSLPPPAPVAAVAPSGTHGVAGNEVASALVNVNTADAATLETLPGIGPVLAKRILEWRTDNGWFASIDELIEVSGIGPALFAKIRDLVTT